MSNTILVAKSIEYERRGFVFVTSLNSHGWRGAFASRAVLRAARHGQCARGAPLDLERRNARDAAIWHVSQVVVIILQGTIESLGVPDLLAISILVMEQSSQFSRVWQPAVFFFEVGVGSLQQSVHRPAASDCFGYL